MTIRNTIADKRAAGPGGTVSEPEAGVALSNLSFGLIAIDETAESIFKAIRVVKSERSGVPEPADRVPSRIADRLRRLKPSRLESAQIEFRAGSRRYRARVFVMTPGNGFLPDRCLLFYVEQETSARDALVESALRFNLSDRELEALAGIAVGLTSKEIAVHMNISPSTVDQFLRMVMIKTGARNRAGILAKLLSCSPHSDERSADGETRPASSSAPPFGIDRRRA
jgi:DNA-binding CsgD family transcriptional regulator